MTIKTGMLGGWNFYINPEAALFDREKCGKWMIFCKDPDFVRQICRAAVADGAVAESKWRSDMKSVACVFYVNGDDRAAHKRVIRYFLEHDLIPKTKNGRLYNISFKFDCQTRANEYGEAFHPKITLADFLDLETGAWKD